jgi:putative transposase
MPAGLANGRWCDVDRAMKAAQAFLGSAPAVIGVTPERVTTDGHASYPRAIRTVLGTHLHRRTSRYRNHGR